MNPNIKEKHEIDHPPKSGLNPSPVLTGTGTPSSTKNVEPLPNLELPTTTPNISDIDRITESLRDIAHLQQLYEQKTSFNNVEKEKIVDIIYKAIISEFDTFGFGRISEEVNNKMVTLIRELYNTKCVKGKRGESEKKIRACYIALTLREPDSDKRKLLQIAKKGLRVYPVNNIIYHYLISRLYGILEEHETGLEYVNKSLLEFPDHSHLLRLKTGFLPNVLGRDEKDVKVIIATYENYLRGTPSDNWNVPHAYYLMACLYNQIANFSHPIKAKNARKIMENYYSLGIEAEKRVHPVFQKRVESYSRVKTELGNMLTRLKLKSLKSSSSSSDNGLGMENVLRIGRQRIPLPVSVQPAEGVGWQLKIGNRPMQTANVFEFASVLKRELNESLIAAGCQPVSSKEEEKEVVKPSSSVDSESASDQPTK